MDPQKIKALDKAHHIHSWSIQSQLDPMVFDHGLGAVIWDAEGNRYLDFSSQLVNLNTGHQHPEVVSAIQEWAGKCCYIGPGVAYESRSMLVEKMAGITPEGINHFFFTLGGAESNENAIKMARQFTGKNKIISRYRSYHGASAGAIALTGDPRRWPTEPGMAGVLKVLDPYCYRCPFSREFPSCNLQCAEHVREVMMYEGAKDHVAAMIVEGITGTNGVFLPPEGYYRRLREICDEFEVLLICDEVMSGFGRTGKWFAFENWDIEPDIITMAKGITNGTVPMGATFVTGEIFDAFMNGPENAIELFHGYTYSAHPLAVAAALATLDTYAEEGLLTRADELAPYWEEKIHAFRGLPHVIDIRNYGLVGAIEFAAHPVGVGKRGYKVFVDAYEKGLLVRASGDIIAVAPPLIISKEQIDELFAILRGVLENLD